MTSDAKPVSSPSHAEGLPLTFDSLVIENTNRCTAKCAMCYQSAGPKGSDVLGKHSLSLEVMKRAILDAVHIRSLSPRFHLAGGEAFIFEEQCFELVDCARKGGYVQISVTTNGYWAQKSERARRITDTLRRLGLTTMEISWDHWHKPYIDESAIENAVNACYESGIDVTLRVLATKTHGFHEALASLSPFTRGRSNQITCAPLFPTGRAATQIPAADVIRRGSPLSGTCHATLNLTINSSGDVFPCCAGLDQTDNVRFGNVNDETIVSIYERMNADSLVRLLVFGGIREVLALLNADLEEAERKYANICHACWDVFSDPELVKTLRARVPMPLFADLHAAAMRRQHPDPMS